MSHGVPKNFYIFRHGECPLNVSGHIQGRTIDGELTERGKLQAEEVGKKLQNRKIEIMICSPMKRARQTAAIVNRWLKVPIFIDHRLTEVNMGEVEGMHQSLLEKKYPDLYSKWRNCKLDDFSTRFEGGETKAEVRQRVFAALNYYAEHTVYENIAVSGHGIIISQILLSLGIERSNIPNGAVLLLQNHMHQWHSQGFVE